jgi:sialate O-acetylesterase
VKDENPGWQYDDPTMKNPYNGVAWYRAQVTIPEALRGRDLYFDADMIDDYDETYFNGQQIGRTGKETPQWWAVPRHYKLPPELIRFGAPNTLAVRVTDTAGSGGFGGKNPPRLAVPPGAGAFSPYLEDLSDYDINAFHNW